MVIPVPNLRFVASVRPLYGLASNFRHFFQLGVVSASNSFQFDLSVDGKLFSAVGSILSAKTDRRHQNHISSSFLQTVTNCVSFTNVSDVVVVAVATDLASLDSRTSVLYANGSSVFPGIIIVGAFR